MNITIERAWFSGRKYFVRSWQAWKNYINPSRSYGANVVEICPCWLPVDGALVQAAVLPCTQHNHTLIKKKIKFSSPIRKFRMQQLQSHIWLTASSYMGKYLRISSYIRKPFLIYDFATAPLWISLQYIWGKFDFLFYQWVELRILVRLLPANFAQ